MRRCMAMWMRRKKKQKRLRKIANWSIFRSLSHHNNNKYSINNRKEGIYLHYSCIFLLLDGYTERLEKCVYIIFLVKMMMMRREEKRENPSKVMRHHSLTLYFILILSPLHDHFQQPYIYYFIRLFKFIQNFYFIFLHFYRCCCCRWWCGGKFQSKFGEI